MAQHLWARHPDVTLPSWPFTATLAAPAWSGGLGELSEPTVLWLCRGLKLIKELVPAFISLYLPAIYMLMRARVSSGSPAPPGASGKMR